VQTTSYAVDLQLIGVRDFPAQMGAAAGASDFTEEARFGVEWLLRMWNDKTRTLYYQVGIGEGNSSTVGDHDIWRLPQEDDAYGGSDPAYRFIRHRPVFRAGSPVSPNLAGRDAAAFALCFQVFHAEDPQLAERCLLAGEHIFELASTDPQGNLLTAIPFDFYPETEWRDDLELGASELAIALDSGDALPPCPAHGGNAFARFDSKAVYKDNAQSYTTTEPAIDLTASSMLAFSWQIASAVPLSGGPVLSRGLAAPPWISAIGGAG
jgi:hypothetical protein